MKFLVEITAPADKGPEIDAAGGPGPIVAELMKRFAPEVMYGAADGRTLTFVADLPTALDVAVLMEISSDRLYEQDEAPTGPKHTNRFSQRRRTCLRVGQVVQDQTADDHIGAAARQRQVTHVGRVQFNPLRHTHGNCVGPGRLGTVTRLVDTAPHVDPDRPAPRETDCSRKQHRTSSAAEVDQRLVPTHREPVELLLAAPHRAWVARKAGRAVPPRQGFGELPVLRGTPTRAPGSRRRAGSRSRPAVAGSTGWSAARTWPPGHRS